jgi:hypothetical protein
MVLKNSVTWLASRARKLFVTPHQADDQLAAVTALVQPGNHQLVAAGILLELEIIPVPGGNARLDFVPGNQQRSTGFVHDGYMRGDGLVQRHLFHQGFDFTDIVISEVLAPHQFQVGIAILENTDHVTLEKYRYPVRLAGGFVELLFFFVGDEVVRRDPDKQRQNYAR